MDDEYQKLIINAFDACVYGSIENRRKFGISDNDVDEMQKWLNFWHNYQNRNLDDRKRKDE